MRKSVHAWAIALAMFAWPMPASAQQTPARSTEEMAKAGEELLKLYGEWDALQEHMSAVIGNVSGSLPQDCDAACLQRLFIQSNAKKAEAFDRLRDIVRKHGWVASPPWRREVESTALAAIASQFTSLKRSTAADNAVAFVKPLLPAFRDRVAAKGMEAHTYAVIADAVELYEGRKQVYGSRFECVDGKYASIFVLEPEHLNERRASIGLEAIEDATFSGFANMQAYCARTRNTAAGPPN